jgi:GC-rich sequence DNA-binding factor
MSLDGGSNHGAAEGLSDEEPEFRSRIAMFGEKGGDGKKGVFEVVDERVDERFGDVVVEEEDEEEKMWEEEQFRKGLGKRMDEGPSRVVVGDVPVVQVTQQPNFVVPSAANVYGAVPNVAAATLANTSIGGAIPATPALDVIPISQQAEIAKRALLDNVRRLKV